MKEFNITPLSEGEARQLTEEIKKDYDNLGERILEAYRRRVWEVLGYKNFASYTEAEFGLSKTESYSLRRNTLTTLSLLPELGEEAHKIPANQKELLHKLPSEQRAEGFREAQRLAKNKGREKPIAKDIKQVVAAKLGEPETKSSNDPQPPKASQSPEVLSDNSDNLIELRKKLRRKTWALEEALRVLDQVRKEARELRRENEQLKNLLSSLGGI